MIRKLIVFSILSLVITPGTTMAQVGTNQGLLNPNLASPEELAQVPYIDASGVQSIVDGRPFLSMTEVQKVAGAGLTPEQLDAVYAALWLPIDLNTVSSEEIGLIPGVGQRMTHEFEEYRPYIGLAQFRREIGKYVDDDEVARLEQYVFVPLDLNGAAAEDFQTIPGVGNRMVHEFMEYRPYQEMAQFRREIGKYVDDAEVARLERYLRLGGS